MRADGLESHRVELVGGQSIRLHCIACGRELANVPNHHPRLTRAYADLDGKPFVDYYCASCAIERGAKLDPTRASAPTDRSEDGGV